MRTPAWRGPRAITCAMHDTHQASSNSNCLSSHNSTWPLRTLQDSLTSTIYEAAIVNEEGEPAGSILVQVEIRGADGKVIQAAAPPAPVAAAPPANGNIHQNMYAQPPPQAAAPPPAQPMATGMLSENELFQIWNVLDNDRSGALTKPEMVKVGRLKH